MIYLLITLLVLFYTPILFADYSYTEQRAIRHSSPNQDGEIVYERKIGNTKIVLTDEKRYDTILAAKINDTSITKVIASNEGYDKDDLTLTEVKEQSSVFVEMDVINGYAASYVNLSISDTGTFIFRGLDQEGKIISIE